MEAKDTVMTLRKQAKVWLQAEQDMGFLKDCDVEGALSDPNLFNDIEQSHSQATSSAQAEITWDITFKEGEKKVVEWIRSHWSQTKQGYCAFIITPEEWQEFLKSEGIE